MTTRSALTRIRAIGLALGAGLAMSLTGCATYFGAEVTSYHQPDQPLKGLSFRFSPTEEQRESLEYQAYAALLRQQLLRHGLLEAGGQADLRVEVDYGTDTGRPVRYTQPQYGYVFQGMNLVRRERVDANGQRVQFYESVPVYGYDVIGYSSYLRTVYRHQLKLTMTGTRPQPGRPARLYEGTAVSESEDGATNNAMPWLVRALFQNFPGPNGQTRHVRVEQTAGAPDETPGGRADQAGGTLRPDAAAPN